MIRIRPLGIALAISTFAVAAGMGQTLNIGDDAPTLEGTKWFNGDALDLAGAKGKNVVVVEFWATWCGPCIASMPHLTELQKEYADKGVIIIGVTRPDPNNALEKVEEFVGKNTDKMGYRVAFDGNETTFKGYMTAAGQNGIPTSFIVDRDGRIAWIGHPMNMDQPLAEIVAGTHDLQRARAVKGLETYASQLQRKLDFEGAARAYEAIATLDPESPAPWASLARMYSYQLDWPGKTREAAQKAVKLAHNDGVFLTSFATFLAGRDEKYKLQALSLTAAKRAMELDEHSTDARLALIRALIAVDNLPEATRMAGETIELLHDAGELADLANSLSREKEALRPLAVKAAERSLDLEPDNTKSNLALVTALTSAGRVDDAMSAARQAIKVIGDNAPSMARLANALATPELEGRCGALALEAINAAMAAEPEEPTHVQTKFRILALCQKDLKAAAAAADYAIEKGGDSAGFLNNFAWSMLTDEGLAGNFNAQALEAAQRCHELTEGKNWMYLDTLALAKFETGAASEAVEIQTKAVELAKEKGVTGPSLTSLEDALARFKGGAKTQ